MVERFSIVSQTRYFEGFYFACSKDTDAFSSIWVLSSGCQLRSWCPGLVYLKLLPNVKHRNTPLEECSSEATRLKFARLNCLNALSDATKKSRVKASISSLVKKSANWTIEPRRRDRKTSCRIEQGSTWNGPIIEVHFHCRHLFVSPPLIYNSDKLRCWRDFARECFVSAADSLMGAVRPRGMIGSSTSQPEIFSSRFRRSC